MLKLYDVTFKDYMDLYRNINTCEWITLFEENEKKNYENDIFTFCALLDKDKINENDYMNKFDWGFSTTSFGRAGFGKSYSSDNEQVYFYDGEVDENFEYLIALRYFDKYNKSVEINPKFIWYYDLVNLNNNYVNPINDEIIIKTSECKIEVRREYLKDFLCAFQKVCIIAFDHRRYFNSLENIEEKFENVCENNLFLNLTISDERGFNSEYNSYSCIIGKVIVTPFKKPHHPDYKQYTENEKFESFIVAYDEEENDVIEYTCNEHELSNYFGANLQAPHFLTPIYFDIKVLDKYKNDPRNYTISDSNINYLNEWGIPFSINEESKVVVWLGDLGRLTYEEQKYWKAFNQKPKGCIEKKFFERQIKSVWTDASRIDSKLVPTLNRFNSLIFSKYGDVIFSVLSETDKEIYNTFMIPTNFSMPEYQSFLIKLSKLVAESINVKLIKKVMKDKYDASIGGSVLQLGGFLKYTGIDVNGAICTSIKRAYDSRNKLAGHTASASEYNKVWGRNKDFKFNSIEDSRLLLENIIGSIEYSIMENESK